MPKDEGKAAVADEFDAKTFDAKTPDDLRLGGCKLGCMNSYGPEGPTCCWQRGRAGFSHDGVVCIVCHTVARGAKLGYRCSACGLWACNMDCVRATIEDSCGCITAPNAQRQGSVLENNSIVHVDNIDDDAEVFIVENETMRNEHDEQQIANMLERAVRRPALTTVPTIPQRAGLPRRFARLMQTAIMTHTEAGAKCSTRPPTEARQKELEASRWLWLVPTLLL